MARLTPNERRAIFRQIAAIKDELQAFPDRGAPAARQIAKLKELNDKLTDLNRRLREDADAWPSMPR